MAMSCTVVCSWLEPARKTVAKIVASFRAITTDSNHAALGTKPVRRGAGHQSRGETPNLHHAEGMD